MNKKYFILVRDENGNTVFYHRRKSLIALVKMYEKEAYRSNGEKWYDYVSGETKTNISAFGFFAASCNHEITWEENEKYLLMEGRK